MALLDQLDALQVNIPIAQDKALQRQKTATQVQLQQTLKQAPKNVGATELAQTLAPAGINQMTEAAGKIQTQGLQEQEAINQQRNQALGQQAQAVEASQQLNSAGRVFTAEQQAQQTETTKRLGIQREISTVELKQREQLADLGLVFDENSFTLSQQQVADLNKMRTNYAGKLFGERQMFKQEEGRYKIASARQLADFATLEARNEIQAKAKLQQIQQSYEQASMVNEMIHKELISRMKREADRSDFETAKKYNMEVAWLQRNYTREKAQRDATAAEIAAYISGGATVIKGGAEAYTAKTKSTTTSTPEPETDEPPQYTTGAGGKTRPY